MAQVSLPSVAVARHEAKSGHGAVLRYGFTVLQRFLVRDVTMPTQTLPPVLPVHSWYDWFAAAEASGLSGADWLTHWWDVLLPALRRSRIRWKGPMEVLDRPWDVDRWGRAPLRQHGLVNWDRRPPNTWREALAWGLLAHDPKDDAWGSARAAAPVDHPMATPHRRARQWYAQGLRFTADDVSFWMERMLESGIRDNDQPAYGGASDVEWKDQMGRVEGPLRAAVEVGHVSLDAFNADVERWWAYFEAPEKKGGLRNAPYLLTYLLRQGFAGAAHWRQRLLDGQSHWDAVDSAILLAVAKGAPLDLLGQPWAVATGRTPCSPPWTFAHACVEHFQRKVKDHEVLLPVDIWWHALRLLNERQAPLFFAAARPADGAFLNPWEHARLRAEDPQGSNHRALYRNKGVFSRPLDAEVKKAVLGTMEKLRAQERKLLLAEVGHPTAPPSVRPRL